MPANDIIDRIEKLLRRTTENGATTAEAEQALAYAQKLMDKHNIELAEVMSHNQDAAPKFDDVGEEPVQFKAKFETFEKSVAHTVCTMCDLKFYYRNHRYPKKRIEVVFYGLQRDIDIGKMLYAELTLMSRVMARHHLGKKWTQSHWHYCNGFAYGLQIKADEWKAERDRQRSTNTNALIVLKDELIAQYQEKNLKLRTARSSARQNTHTDEFQQGVRDGKDYDLSVDRNDHLN